jgi:hypothetical protein
MPRDIEVQDAAAIVADDEEAVQNPKGESGDAPTSSSSWPISVSEMLRC